MFINISIYNIFEFNFFFGSGYDEVDFNFFFIRFFWLLFCYNSVLNLKKKIKLIIFVYKLRNISIIYYVIYVYLVYFWILFIV